MDFMLKLEQLKAACGSAAPDYVAYLNETIESLQRMRDNFKHDEQDSSGVLTSRLLEINKELEAMAATGYEGIPEGYVASDAYFRKVNEIEGEISEFEARIQNPLLRPRKHWNLAFSNQMLDSKKMQLMMWLENYQPFDVEPYLAKKRQLLDEKLALLKDLRKLKA